MVAGCWQVYFGSQRGACGKSSGCFRAATPWNLPYIPSFCPDTQPTYVIEGVNSLCLTGKCYPHLPHSSRKVYTRTGLIPQGFNDKVLRPKKSQKNTNRQENSLSIAWEIWLHSHTWLLKSWKMEETFLHPVGKSWYWRAVPEGLLFEVSSAWWLLRQGWRNTLNKEENSPECFVKIGSSCKNLHSPPKSRERVLKLFQYMKNDRWERGVQSEEREKLKENAGNGRVIGRKGILAKSNFNLRGDAEWERDCYMDITGVCVCTCKGG